jgi:hypothetical protein
MLTKLLDAAFVAFVAILSVQIAYDLCRKSKKVKQQGKSK